MADVAGRVSCGRAAVARVGAARGGGRRVRRQALRQRYRSALSGGVREPRGAPRARATFHLYLPLWAQGSVRPRTFCGIARHDLAYSATTRWRVVVPLTLGLVYRYDFVGWTDTDVAFLPSQLDQMFPLPLSRTDGIDAVHTGIMRDSPKCETGIDDFGAQSLAGAARYCGTATWFSSIRATCGALPARRSRGTTTTSWRTGGEPAVFRHSAADERDRDRRQRLARPRLLSQGKRRGVSSTRCSTPRTLGWRWTAKSTARCARSDHRRWSSNAGRPAIAEAYCSTHCGRALSGVGRAAKSTAEEVEPIRPQLLLLGGLEGADITRRRRCFAHGARQKHHGRQPVAGVYRREYGASRRRRSCGATSAPPTTWVQHAAPRRGCSTSRPAPLLQPRSASRFIDLMAVAPLDPLHRVDARFLFLVRDPLDTVVADSVTATRVQKCKPRPGAGDAHSHAWDALPCGNTLLMPYEFFHGAPDAGGATSGSFSTPTTACRRGRRAAAAKNRCAATCRQAAPPRSCRARWCSSGTTAWRRWRRRS